MRRITFLGGPRDGETVDYFGPEYRMPVPRPVAAFYPEPIPSYESAYRVDTYRAQRDRDGRWWYVRESF